MGPTLEMAQAEIQLVVGRRPLVSTLIKPSAIDGGETGEGGPSGRLNLRHCLLLIIDS